MEISGKISEITISANDKLAKPITVQGEGLSPLLFLSL